MTALRFAPVDDATADLLSLVADDYSALGKVRMQDFRDACWTDAQAHDGWVHPSRVSAILHARFGQLHPQSLSAKWAPAAGRDGFLDVTDKPAPIDPTHSKGNGNKSTVYRYWRGWVA